MPISVRLRLPHSLSTRPLSSLAMADPAEDDHVNVAVEYDGDGHWKFSTDHASIELKMHKTMQGAADGAFLIENVQHFLEESLTKVRN